jgi:hypothetical protein
MKGNGRKVRRRHATDPRCHWCGRETVIGARKSRGRQAAHCATLDHVCSRHTDVRPSPVVLACSGCNQWRARVEDRLLSGDPGLHARAARMLADRSFVRDPFPDGSLPAVASERLARLRTTGREVPEP